MGGRLKARIQDHDGVHRADPAQRAVGAQKQVSMALAYPMVAVHADEIKRVAAMLAQMQAAVFGEPPHHPRVEQVDFKSRIETDASSV